MGVWLVAWATPGPPVFYAEHRRLGVHIRLVISIGCFMSYGSAIKGPPVFYAEHRRSMPQSGNLALLSLKGPPSLLCRA